MTAKLRKGTKAAPSFPGLTDEGKKRKGDKASSSTPKKPKVDEKPTTDDDNEDDDNDDDDDDDEPDSSLSPPKESPTPPSNALNIRPRRTIKAVSKSSNPKMPTPADGTELEYESEEYSHRPKHIIYTEGMTIPSGIASANRPVYLDVNEDLKANPPPEKCHLSDVTVFQILTSGITNRERNRKWPGVFESNGHIVKTRPNFGQSATLKCTEDGKAYDLIYRSYYILHGDTGANGSSDDKPWQTKDPRELAKDNKDPFSYNNDDVSLSQPSVTLSGKLLPPNVDTVKVKGKGKVTGDGGKKKQKKKSAGHDDKSRKSKDPVVAVEGKSDHEKDDDDKGTKLFWGHIYGLGDINGIKKQDGEIKFYMDS